MLGEDLVSFESPANMVFLERDVAGFGGDKGCGGKFYGGGVVFEHYRGRRLGET